MSTAAPFLRLARVSATAGAFISGMVASGQTFAQEAVQRPFTAFIAPYTLHWSDAEKESADEPDAPKHAYVFGAGLEYRLDPRYFVGFYAFRNSFGQPSQYAYVGARFVPFEQLPEFYAKVTAGVIHGYKKPYHKKIPVNTSSGWGLGILPAVGWQFNDRLSAQIAVLGTAGLQLNLGVDF